jgi:hypothetical protein
MVVANEGGRTNFNARDSIFSAGIIFVVLIKNY